MNNQNFSNYFCSHDGIFLIEWETTIESQLLQIPFSRQPVKCLQPRLTFTSFVTIRHQINAIQAFILKYWAEELGKPVKHLQHRFEAWSSGPQNPH